MSSKLRKQSDEASVFIRVTTRAWPKPTNRYIHTLHIPIPIGSKLELSILEVIHFAEDQSPTKHKNVYSDEILRPRSMKPIHFTRGPPNWGGLSWISKSLTRSIPSQKATIGECQVSYHLKGPQDWDPKGDNGGGAITWDSCNHRVLADSRDVPKQIHNAEEILPLRRRRHNHEPERDVRALRTQMTTQFRSQVWSRLFRRRCVSLNANRVQVSLELLGECKLVVDLNPVLGAAELVSYASKTKLRARVATVRIVCGRRRKGGVRGCNLRLDGGREMARWARLQAFRMRPGEEETNFWFPNIPFHTCSVNSLIPKGLVRCGAVRCMFVLFFLSFP